MNKNRAALTESLNGLKQDLVAEKESRLIVENCLYQRIDKLEFDLNKKEEEILHLKSSFNSFNDADGFFVNFFRFLDLV